MPAADIPIAMREASERAVDKFAHWDHGGPEPQILFDGQTWAPLSVEAVCTLVMRFADVAPGNFYRAVCELAEEFHGNRQAVGHQCFEPSYRPADQSYASVARCLLGLYHARKDFYQRRR